MIVLDLDNIKIIESYIFVYIDVDLIYKKFVDFFKFFNKVREM